LQAALEVAFRPAVLAGLVCYGVSVVLWIWVLSRAEVSFAYPFLGLGFVLVALVGWAFLGETLSVQKLAATGLIVIGVVLMAISDKAL
jgi:multidrug transporter EmrE-like cation transporter